MTFGVKKNVKGHLKPFSHWHDAHLTSKQTAPSITNGTMTSTHLEYEWPTLVEEGSEMLASAILMYGLADLRALARTGLLSKGNAEVNDRIVTLPVSADDILEATAANQDELKANYNEGQLQMQGNALKRATELSSTTSLSQELLVFDDENSESELVYGIEINNARKRITVGFRGSVTPKDFLIDSKAYIRELPNPALENEDSGKTIGIHHGFYGKKFVRCPFVCYFKIYALNIIFSFCVCHALAGQNTCLIQRNRTKSVNAIPFWIKL